MQSLIFHCTSLLLLALNQERADNIDYLAEKIKISEIEFNNLSKEKQNVIKKHKINADPFQIKNEIERLESRIETEVMSFEREKEIMKRIKELSREYKDSKKISSVFGKVNSI